MTFQQELSSWFSPLKASSSPPPPIGAPAPSPPILALEPGKRTIIAFLRHCGCPFAEKTFLRMREAAKTHGDVEFLAVSHSSREATEKWHSFLHVLDPRALSNAFGLGKEGINVRPTESGSRWQTSGTYAIGDDGRVKFGGPAARSDDMPEFEEYVKKLDA
ncbi:Alkyl hydroperoxide reductase subunit C Thiol specific antioxidant [Lecanosticta acicola]|uniref:Alkyl hydroperoxide reductase subunit C Thiol specific antioxidant n=1 Tax=Lecanosticta acicola TaxID=111012 RepID=A0AAI8Z433_9PEZI|nr:Alkyl hydroperoxide reductase subunit C Thiol specific antioxidant [Lecanosticta acicola]